MHFRAALLALLVVASFAPAARANSPLVESHFGSGDEGWTNVTLPYPSAVPPTITFTFTPTWSGGQLSMTDPDGTGVGNSQYWKAPAKFLGDQSAAGVLGCSLSDQGTGGGPYQQEDVVLVGGGITISYIFSTIPPQGSVPSPVTLDLYGGTAHLGGMNAPLATSQQVHTVLSALTEFYIRAEYQLGPDFQYMDDVVLFTPNAGVGDGPRADALTLELASPNPSRGATQVRYQLPRSGAVDLAVFDAAGRRVATLASGDAAAGTRTATWDGHDPSGRAAGAGLYWLRLVQGSEERTTRIVRMR